MASDPLTQRGVASHKKDAAGAKHREQNVEHEGASIVAPALDAARPRKTAIPIGDSERKGFVKPRLSLVGRSGGALLRLCTLLRPTAAQSSARHP